MKRRTVAAPRPPEARLKELVRLARQARRRAYAPFSKFKVGAALRTGDGEIVTGCNIENATYGLTVCAERVALLKAVSEGLRGFDVIAVVVDSTKLAAPCGPCRQLLWELAGDIWVHTETTAGQRRTALLSVLLPLPFDRSNL